jgi:hypothetical protein
VTAPETVTEWGIRWHAGDLAGVDPYPSDWHTADNAPQKGK